MNFIDANKNDWPVKIDIGAIKKIRDNIKDRAGNPVDMMDLVNDRLAFTLISDPVMLADILWLLCNETAKTRNVTKEVFVSLLWGDILDESLNALILSMADFFPKRQRPIVTEIATITQEIQNRCRMQMLRQLKEQADKIATPTVLTIEDKNSGTESMNALPSRD